MKVETKIIKINPVNPEPQKIAIAAACIKKGDLVAFPTETVYGLGANALDATAVEKIFAAKGRPSDNPLIVHVASIDDVKKIAKNIPESSKLAMSHFWPGPLTIILKKRHLVPSITTAGLDTVAVRIPKNKIALEIIKQAGCPIAAPSANTFSKPSPTLASHVYEDLNSKVNIIVDGGACSIGVESTVIAFLQKTPMVLRPGGVTIEQLEAVFGKVLIHPSVVGVNEKVQIAMSPGMKYKHYSPKAKVVLITGSRDEIQQKLDAFSSENFEQKIGVITSMNQFDIKADSVKFAGQTFAEVAQNIFRLLREMDNELISVIAVTAVDDADMGFAVMNRLKKAASKII